MSNEFCWYIEKLIILLTPILLILIGIAGKRCSLKIQKFISFPLIVSSSLFLSWFVITNFWIGIKGVVIFGYNIEPFLCYPSAISAPIIGFICGILIANKNLKIELKITFSNTTNLLAGVLGGIIIGAIVIAVIFVYLIKGFFHPFFTDCIVTLISCLGGACGAIIFHRKLSEKNQ